jgi:hypothetical protein
VTHERCVVGAPGRYRPLPRAPLSRVPRAAAAAAPACFAAAAAPAGLIALASEAVLSAVGRTASSDRGVGVRVVWYQVVEDKIVDLLAAAGGAVAGAEPPLRMRDDPRCGVTVRVLLHRVGSGVPDNVPAPPPPAGPGPVGGGDHGRVGRVAAH